MKQIKKFIKIILIILVVLMCIAQATKLSQKFHIDEKINILKGPVCKKRDFAIKSLVRMGERAVNPLLLALKYDQTTVQSGFLNTFIRIFPQKNLKKLEAQLREEKENMQAGVCEVLGKIGDKRAINPIVELLKTTKSKTVINEASTALGKMGTPAVQPLIELLKNKDWLVRNGAIKALGMIKSPDAVKALIGMMGEEKSYINKPVANALREIGYPAFDFLNNELKSKDRDIRAKSAFILGQIGDYRGLPSLLEAYNNDDSTKVKQVSINAISLIDDPRSVDIFIGALKSKKPELRSLIVNKLGESGNNKALETLSEMLVTEDILFTEKTQALFYVENNSNPKMIRHLIKFKKDAFYGKDPYPCRINSIIEHLTDNEAISEFIKLLDDENCEIRKKARGYLSNIGRPAVKQLKQALNSPSKRIRNEARKALNEIETDSYR